MIPTAVEAIGGDLGIGTSTEAVWHPSYPFKSSLTGETARALSDTYEGSTGKQWTEALAACYGGYEIVANALKRAQTLEKEALRKALTTTDLDTVLGHIKFTEKNISITPSGALQWIKGKKFVYHPVLVSNGNYKMLPKEAKLVSIRELRGIK
jgi:branched-chain amino acid transport system substrate-binding protein